MTWLDDVRARFTRALLRRTGDDPSGPAPETDPGAACVLVIVEGVHDAQFLRRISAMLHASDTAVPDLGALERRRALAFLPFGGGDPRPWALRLAGAGPPQFYLFDRDLPPDSEVRQEVARVLNRRARCRAAVTSKRALENYLHPDAIFAACGLRVSFGDEEDVAEQVARQAYLRTGRDVAWAEQPARARKRWRHRVKRMLNTAAVDLMTPEHLAQRDPAGEVLGWLAQITGLAQERHDRGAKA